MDDRQDEFRVEGAPNLTGGQLSAVQAAAGDPARLETLYQSARTSGAAQGFAAAIEVGYGVVRDELLAKITSALGRMREPRQALGGAAS